MEKERYPVKKIKTEQQTVQKKIILTFKDDSFEIEINSENFAILKQSETFANILLTDSVVTISEENLEIQIDTIPCKIFKDHIWPLMQSLYNSKKNNQSNQLNMHLQKYSIEELVDIINIISFLDIPDILQETVDSLSLTILSLVILNHQIIKDNTTYELTIKTKLSLIKSLEKLPKDILNLLFAQLQNNEIFAQKLLSLPPQILDHHSALILYTAFSPNNKWLVTVSNNMVCLYDCSENYIRFVEKFIITTEITSFTFSPDSNYLALGSSIGEIFVLNFSDPVIKDFSIKVHTKKVSCLAFSPDGNYLASGSYDNTVHIFNYNKNGITSLKTIINQATCPKVISFSPASEYLVCQTSNQSLYLYSVVDDFLPLNPLLFHYTHSNQTVGAFLSKENYFATHSSGIPILYKISENGFEPIAFEIFESKNNSSQFLFYPCEEIAAIATKNNACFYTCTRETFENMKKNINNPISDTHEITQIVCPNGKKSAWLSSNHNINIDIHSFQKDIKTLLVLNHPALMNFSPDGKLFVRTNLMKVCIHKIFNDNFPLDDLKKILLPDLVNLQEDKEQFYLMFKTSEKDILHPFIIKK
jgi:WD40 repeat protein